MPLKIAAFLQALAETGIVPPAECAKLEQAFPAERRQEDAKPLAIDLVRRKLLTQFQALNLYHDKSQFLVLGNYVLLDVLGEGGMGKVYKALHRRMKRTVALKLLPAELTKNSEAVKRFQREVQAAAQLVHPNIVTAYDADEANGVYFLVMEFVAGQDLNSYLKEQGPLPVAQAVDFVCQVSKGLEFAHAKGVIHRDIKPSNLILNRDGVVKVLDLGMARFEEALAEPEAFEPSDGSAGAKPVRRERTELTKQGQVMGTVSYMSPEQTIGNSLADARSDIYSLGCTLYRLLTGEVPFPCDTAEAMMTAHRKAPIPSLRKFRRDVTPELDAVVRKMLSKQPAERYESMRDVRLALQTLTVEGGPAQHVSQKAPGDDFKSDLLSSLLNLGPGSAGALLEASQAWNPTDHARQRTANQSGTVANQAAPPPGVAPRPREQPQRRKELPWNWIGVGVVLLMIGVGAMVYFKTAKTTDTTTVANAGDAAKKSEPDANGESKASVDPKTPAANPGVPEEKSNPAGSTQTPPQEAKQSPPAEPAKKGPPPKPSPADRRVAEWFAGTYGVVDVQAGEPPQIKQVKTRADIPRDPFYVESLYFDRIPTDPQLLQDFAELSGLIVVGTKEGVTVTEQLVKAFHGSASLHSLSLHQCRIDEPAMAQLRHIPNLKGIQSIMKDPLPPRAYEHIAACPRVTMVGISIDQQSSDRSLDDSAVATLSKMSGLISLHLSSDRITDTGINSIASLSNLKAVSISSTAVTDEGVANLSNLRQLESLQLTNVRMRGEGLANVGRVTGLQYVTLNSLPITDDGVRSLVACRNIKNLGLQSCEAMTDESLRAVASLPELEILDVSINKKITDAGFRHLHNCKSLKRIQLYVVNISAQALADLRRALPACAISSQ